MANSYDTQYLFMDHEAKRQYLIARMAEAEQLHFELMIDKLDESHSDYDNWLDTITQLTKEIERLRYLYKQYGGTLGSELPVIQDDVLNGD
jgi:hypothetical protein